MTLERTVVKNVDYYKSVSKTPINGGEGERERGGRGREREKSIKFTQQVAITTYQKDSKGAHHSFLHDLISASIFLCINSLVEGVIDVDQTDVSGKETNRQRNNIKSQTRCWLASSVMTLCY